MTGVAPPRADGNPIPLPPAQPLASIPAVETPRRSLAELRAWRPRVRVSSDGTAELLALLRETSEALRAETAACRETARTVMADSRALLDAIRAARAPAAQREAEPPR